MTEEQNSIARNEDRHSHITIRLRCRVGETWEPLDALDWNAAGFNFYHACELHGPVLELKRGLVHFQGTVVWSALKTGDEVQLGALLNELIFKRAKDLAQNVALHQRLLKLIRVHGMVEQKRKILASLGLEIADAKLADMVAQRRLAHPMFHYGVKVDAQAWRAVVNTAVNFSSVVSSLEQWSESFSRLSH